MSKDSIRGDIIKLLCDTDIFPIGYTDYSWEIFIKIKDNWHENIKNDDAFYKSVREALETVNGYIYWDGSSTKIKRQLEETIVDCPPKHKNPHKYVKIYKFLDVMEVAEK